MDAERFMSLLRPVRDASLAFEVDVSAELEEYIEQCVRHIGMDESHLVNFAEAGLLVQGSAMILGRKVEHLHGLVYKVLANLKNRGRDDEDEDDDASAVDDPNPREGSSTRSPTAVLDSELALGKAIDLKTPPARPQDPEGPGWTSRDLAQWFFETDDAAAPFDGFVAADNGGFAIPDVGELDRLIIDRKPDIPVAMEVDAADAVAVAPPPAVDDDDDDDAYAPPPPLDDDDDAPMEDAPPPAEDAPAEQPPIFSSDSENADDRAVVRDDDDQDDDDQDDDDDDDQDEELDPHAPDEKVTPYRRGRTTARPRLSSGAGRVEDDVDIEAALACARVSTATATDDRAALVEAARAAVDRRVAARRRNDGYRQRFSALVAVFDDEDDDDRRDRNAPATPAPAIAENDDDDDDGVSPLAENDDDAPPPPAMYDDDDDDPLMGIPGDDDDDAVGADRALRDDRRASMLSAVSCNTISRLARRVAAWQDHLEPILKMREERAPYDAHSAGVDLTSDLKRAERTGLGSKVSFATVADDLPRFEVCRRFMAALQLANEGKVGLSHPNSADALTDRADFCLALLSPDNAQSHLLLGSIDESAEHNENLPHAIRQA